MSAGIYVELNSGKIYDSTSLGIGFVESFIVNPGVSGSKSYPEFAGCKMMGVALTTNSARRTNDWWVFDHACIGTLNITTVYDAAGVPTIRWTRNAPYFGSHSNQAQVSIFVI